jgi:hypothetical protein
LTKDGVSVSDLSEDAGSGGMAGGASPAGAASASVSGPPQPVLLWLWRRAGDEAVAVDGDHALVAKLRDLLGTATT